MFTTMNVKASNPSYQEVIPTGVAKTQNEKRVEWTTCICIAPWRVQHFVKSKQGENTDNHVQFMKLFVFNKMKEEGMVSI